MRIRPAGPAALLVELDGVDEVRALHAELLTRRDDGRLGRVEDIVPGARTVLLDGVTDVASLAAALPTWTIAPVEPEAGPLVELPTVYDGEDLDQVADLWGVRPADVGAIHSGADLHVAFCGFSPGFAYLAGLPERYHVPRRPTPRPSVPAGTVGLAGEFTGVYPRASPGGWQLIGRTHVALWDPSRPQPALLAPGTRVRFVPVEP